MKILSFCLLTLMVFSSCIKQEGKIPPAAAVAEPPPPPPEPGPDPLASYAWHLENTGQTTFSDSAGVAGEDISLTDAINQGVTGKGVTVAVSDSGTDWDHADLEGNGVLELHRNYLPSNSSQWRGSLPTEYGNDAHGTATVGLISALGFNKIGSRGVAYESKFGAFRFVIPYSSSVTESSIIARTIDQTDGEFDIFNYSYGYSDCFFVEEDRNVLNAIKAGVTDLRDGKGAIYVQSAGNGYWGYIGRCIGTTDTTKYAHNPNFSNDLATPFKIIVGAIAATGISSSYSSAGSAIWVSAPGGEYGDDEPAMLTTDITGCSQGYARRIASFNDFNYGRDSLNSNCDYTSTMNGTSSAAPVVSGVAALMLEAEPNLTWRDVKHILAVTAEQSDPVNMVLPHPFGEELTDYDYDVKWTQNQAGFFFSNWYGFGRVNANAAVSMAKTYTFPLGTYETTENPNYKNWYYRSAPLNLAIPDEDKNGVTSSITVNHNFFVEAVTVKLNITHPRPQDLAVHLESPSELFEGRLLNINSGVYAVAFPVDKILISNAFYGENSLGTWTLRVVDGKTGSTGILTDWSLLIHGHRITGTGARPAAPTGVSVVTPFPDTTISTTVTYTPSVSTDVIRYEASVGTSAGATNVAKWYSIGTQTTFNVIKLSLRDNTNYYINLRAVDNEENTSTVVSKVWRVDTDY